jgi:hypothetical protein
VSRPAPNTCAQYFGYGQRLAGGRLGRSTHVGMRSTHVGMRSTHVGMIVDGAWLGDVRHDWSHYLPA